MSKRKPLLPDCWAGTLVFSILWTWTQTLSLPGSGTWWLLEWNYTVNSPGSQTFRLALELHISHGSLVCQLQIMGLLSLRDLMSWCIKINQSINQSLSLSLLNWSRAVKARKMVTRSSLPWSCLQLTRERAESQSWTTTLVRASWHIHTPGPQLAGEASLLSWWPTPHDPQEQRSLYTWSDGV